jgi:hypothetical protein
VMFMSPSRPGALAGWAALVAVLLLLASVGTASAECACVLWSRTLTGGAEIWGIIGAYSWDDGGKVKCDQDALSFTKQREGMARVYSCLPDTIDPRGPKGGGR